MNELTNKPVPDRAENNAYFPSDYSLSLYTSPKTDFAGFQFTEKYTGGKHRILMVGADERYVEMQNGKLFSTGNHPVETLLPMLHMHHAGFEIDVATLSGNSVKLEMWAMPNEDEAVLGIYQEYLPKLQNPLKLADILEDAMRDESPYIGVFFPGGHGALVNLPESKDVSQLLSWAVENEKQIITLCHGPAALLAAAVDANEGEFLFKGYEMAVFPDALDEGANQEIGYMPGRLQWLLAERLESLGVKVINQDITGLVHKDRMLLTGDSPLAANNLGILAANELLKAVK